MEKELDFLIEWIPLDKKHFRILTLVTVLADNNRGFRGTIKEFCDELGIKNSAVNTKSIKESIKHLADNDYLTITIDENIYNISLAAAAEKSKKIIKIKKAWYKMLREDAGATTWENALKVLLRIMEQPQDTPITNEMLGAETGLSKTTVERCVKAICNKKDSDNLRLYKETVTIKNEEGQFVCLGQKYNWGYDWN